MNDGTASRVGTVAPGAMTALLEELVRAPSGRAGWETPLAPGDVVGRFQIQREIGRGGFGVVYEALDRELARSVAFKAVRATTLPEDHAILSEAESAARLAHPNIVHLYDVGRSENGPYLIMELLRGETLSARLRRGPMAMREALRVAVDVSRGLAHAHENGVVHRDLKPANIFLCDDGQVKVLDFGLAALFGRSDASGGTPGYMAPEQRAGAAADERSDVYALGIIVHEMLTGATPGGPAAAAEDAAARSAVRRPAALWRLVDRMRAADPGERPPDATRAHVELLAVARALEPRRHAVMAWTVAALALVAAAVAGLYLRRTSLPAGRLLVAIADVQNATGDRDLDGLSELLEIALTQSPRLSVVPRPRLLELAVGGAATQAARLDETNARAAAGSATAQVLVLPAIRRVDEGFEAELRAVELPGDKPVLVARDRVAGRGAIPDALDRLSDRLLTAVQERRGDRPQKRIGLSTVAHNPEAWMRYAEGKRLHYDGRWAEARAAFARSLEADPEFPLAHIALAFDAKFFAVEDASVVRRHVESALKGLDRLPAKDRALVEAMHARIELRIADAISHFDRAIAAQPEDPVPYYECARMIANQWGDPEAARPYSTKALALAPAADANAIRLLVSLGRLDDAAARARRWADTSPGIAPLMAVVWVERLRGDPGAALMASWRAIAAGAPLDEWDIVWSFLEADALDALEERLAAAGERSFKVLALRGRIRESLAVFDRTKPPPTAPTRARAIFHNDRADLVTVTGDPALVWRDVEEQIRLGLPEARCGGFLLAWMGDLERANHLMNLWSEVDPRFFCTRMYREVTVWRRGDPRAAVRALRGMANWDVEYLRAEMLADAGDHRAAVSEFRDARRKSIGMLGLVLYPRSLHLEALSLEKLGEREEARRVLKRLLTLWRGADADNATLREAKALDARLARAEPAIPPR